MLIEENQIKNKEALGAIIQNITCGICLHVVVNPFTCDICDHLYCEKCLFAWREQNDMCPYKCTSPVFKQASRFVLDILGTLVIKCAGKCKQEYSYEQYLMHAPTCTSEAVHCYNCGHTCQLSQIVTHNKLYSKTMSDNEKLKAQLQAVKKENATLKKKIEKLMRRF